jgi:hypothetical protein
MNKIENRIMTCNRSQAYKTQKDGNSQTQQVHSREMPVKRRENTAIQYEKQEIGG